ncbi:MAG: hypothetical protein EZS28_000894 [Streblomastix strix]|uniref:Uncharacterized protein n=1 Tax=Streblomastix strix TaxID=222440 RepID=A0A5J4X9L1_9EUKA|nr:MAG: hypothetical protein EZS28_000894 [Streblomastix strix]
MPKCQSGGHFGILAFWHFSQFRSKLRIYGREQKAEEHLIALYCKPVEMRSKAPTLVIPGDHAIFNKKSVSVQGIHRRLFLDILNGPIT